MKMEAPAGTSSDRHYVDRGYLSPYNVVKEFFSAMDELRSVGRTTMGGDKRMLDAVECVAFSGENLVLCLDQHVRLYNRESETAQEISGVFRLGLHRILYLRDECSQLKKYVRDLKLADEGLDARGVELKQTPAQPVKKFSVPGSAPKAVSLEDFRKHRDNTLSSKKSVDSSSSIRKTKSESDAAIQSMKKKVDSLTVDNKRLRQSEKKLLKDTVVLNRKCRTLEEARDRAEDRLKIEQTQRDSIEKLRQRNKELEEQLRRLCESQVLREREEIEKQREREGESDNKEEKRDAGEEEEQDKTDEKKMKEEEEEKEKKEKEEEEEEKEKEDEEKEGKEVQELEP